MKNNKTNEELKWQTERDFDILMEYQKLIKDSERLERAKKLAREKKKALSSLLNTKEEKEEA